MISLTVFNLMSFVRKYLAPCVTAVATWIESGVFNPYFALNSAALTATAVVTSTNTIPDASDKTR